MDGRCLNLDDDDATSVSGHYKLLDEMSQKMASRRCHCNFSTLPAVDRFWYLSEQNDSGCMSLYTICCLWSLVFLPTVNRKVLAHGSKQKHYHTHKYFPELEIRNHSTVNCLGHSLMDLFIHNTPGKTPHLTQLSPISNANPATEKILDY
jgi:hypothetical protein